MCIIILKPKNKPFPSEETFMECFFNNPDGIGIGWNDGIRTHIKKGFMTFSHFMEYIDQRSIELIDKDVMIHFRYATHGNIDNKSCHPFVIDRNYPLKYTGNKTIIAHNGIIHGKEFIKKDLSDTMVLVQKINKKGLNHRSIKPILQSGKFIIMSPNKITIYGNFIEDNGIFYSNDTYKPYIKPQKTINQYNFMDYSEDDYCHHSKECIMYGVCYYSGISLDQEIQHSDPLFCPYSMIDIYDESNNDESYYTDKYTDDYTDKYTNEYTDDYTSDYINEYTDNKNE